VVLDARFDREWHRLTGDGAVRDGDVPQLEGAVIVTFGLGDDARHTDSDEDGNQNDGDEAAEERPFTLHVSDRRHDEI
jgi:hypothetical protein